MQKTEKALGIDIGGTRTKMGIVDLESGEIFGARIFDTIRSTHEEMMHVMQQELRSCCEETGIAAEELKGTGVSIGTFVFEDGTIDGMKCFVPFMVEGYPLVPELEKALGMPVRADNDVRIINLAEAVYGAGRGYKKVMTITLGSGVGTGVSEDGKPFGKEAFHHLAGHIKVRNGGEIPALDQELCYCGMRGCFEGTCSGTSLEIWVRSVFGENMTNPGFFDLVKQGDSRAKALLEQYLGYLSDALNQYIYVYCPDVIILGGGVARGLKPYLEEIRSKVVAQVHYRQHTDIVISDLMEDSGILGAALLMK